MQTVVFNNFQSLHFSTLFLNWMSVSPQSKLNRFYAGRFLTFQTFQEVDIQVFHSSQEVAIAEFSAGEGGGELKKCLRN